MADQPHPGGALSGRRPCLVIAAPQSGSGKTTLTLGIMAALTRRGLRVAPFKVGPDFIDPGYHRLATGTFSINLDGWMCGPDFALETFQRHAAGADAAVVEGVMGLFDGIGGASESGSSAQMAKLLRSPVVLVVDARGQARSAAALVHGFVSFDRELNVAGVIFNNVASANHEAVLREAMAAHGSRAKVLGCIPRDPVLAIPSRHLGLVTADENPLSGEFLNHLVQVVERHLDLEALLALELPGAGAGPAAAAGEAEAADTCARVAAEALSPAPRVQSTATPVRLAVAQDAAFCFVYQDNLRLLREAGAQIAPFSPLADGSLPEGISGIYLPGGYPELFASRLAANGTLKEEIRRAVEAGVPVYAECGGFIYLTRALADAGTEHPLVGVFPTTTRMLPRRKALGYREVELLEENILGGKGTVARGHEFHYSEIDPMPQEVERLYRVSRKGIPLGEEGYRYRNCLASYIHLHFGGSPALARSFVEECRGYLTRSLT